MAAKKVLVPIADGSEEIETVCIQDTLVRAGAEVTVASVMPGKTLCKMSRGLQVQADCSIDDCVGKDWDAIALPGGLPGAEHLRDCAALVEMLKAQIGAGKVTAAMCAAPAVVLHSHGLIKDKVTSYPAPKFKDVIGDKWEDAICCVDGNIITSQGPGTSLQYGLKIAEALFGVEKAEEVAKAMLTTRA
eukprot:TRINITY_DN37576_c0_g1_i1.p2 TRINITY_DN37576_c0_g1~~TRINITY_DN37576_c0_g1_i1.p2  ORF type:complete len:189 (+),score=56.59 TRINITY_DN37576_c0_g1_i1:60-626(+)